MDHIHNFLIACTLLSLTTAVKAQDTTPNKTVLVYNEKNEPLPGVVIGVKGTSRKATTDQNGAFQLKYDDIDVLTFSHIGYLYKEVSVGKHKKDFVVHLQSIFKDADQAYQNAFGVKQSVATSVGATSTVSGSDMEKYLSTDILIGLQGRMPGMNITQYRGFDLQRTSVNTTGDLIGNRPASYGQLPFSDNTRYNLSGRGLAPVVIVDGIERELFDIDPENIESVTYEKDALSSMFLGMKSSRGALIINTKNPTQGKVHLAFTGKWGIHSTIKKPEPLNATEYAYMLNEALQKFPQDLNILHLKMKVLEYLNQNEEALRIADYLLEQKIAEEARSETAIYKADILAKLGRTEEVKLFLKNYCAQNKDEELFYLLMMIYVGDRNYKDAANIANLLTEFAETSIYLATAKFTLAEAAKYNNDLEGAKEQYRKLSREFRKLTIDHPELYEVYIFRILCHVEVQEYENAMELADYLEHAYPGMSDGPLYKYYIYKTMGKMDMAEIEKKKALKINPDIRIQW